MNDQVYQEIANEIKGLHNGALVCIRLGQYQEAEQMYSRCMQITELISFHEGSAMTQYGLANLSCLQEQYPLAIQRAERARYYFGQAGQDTEECSVLLGKLAKLARKKGIELERAHRFREAIVHFEAAIPHQDAAGSSALRHEADLLRRILDEGA